jgi:hypothetical protein
MRGVHIRASQELQVHKTLIMTQRYSHLAPEQLQNAFKLLDGVIGENLVLIGEAPITVFSFFFYRNLAQPSKKSNC